MRLPHNAGGAGQSPGIEGGKRGGQVIGVAAGAIGQRQGISDGLAGALAQIGRSGVGHIAEQQHPAKMETGEVLQVQDAVAQQQLVAGSGW